MNDKNIGWLAGVLDGEGCIYASNPWKTRNDNKKRKNFGSNRFDIRILITQIPNLLLEKVGRLLREDQIEYHFYEKGSKGTSYIIINKKSEILKFLNLIVSELSCKKRSAEVVIEYISKWGINNHKYGCTGAPEEHVRDYTRLYNILKKQKVKSLISVETTRYTSYMDEDIVRYSEQLEITN